jgi:hypothetical protein
MNKILIVASTVLLSSVAVGQSHAVSNDSIQLPAKTALPIVFTQTIDADRASVGESVSAKTIQVVTLPDGKKLPKGSLVSGHVVAAAGRVANPREPNSSILAIHFDQVRWGSNGAKLNVYVRAMADPIESWTATEPNGDTENNPTESVVLVGGDLLIPSQTNVLGDRGLTGYNRRTGVYAQLVSASGNAPHGCDSSETLQSTAEFSASACGIYGFTGTALEHSGRLGEASTLVLASTEHSPKIWKGTTALLEVRSTPATGLSR